MYKRQDVNTVPVKTSALVAMKLSLYLNLMFIRFSVNDVYFNYFYDDNDDVYYAGPCVLINIF